MNSIHGGVVARGRCPTRKSQVFTGNIKFGIFFVGNCENVHIITYSTTCSFLKKNKNIIKFPIYIANHNANGRRLAIVKLAIYKSTANVVLKQESTFVRYRRVRMRNFKFKLPQGLLARAYLKSKIGVFRAKIFAFR